MYLEALEASISGLQKGFQKKYPSLESETTFFIAVLVTQLVQKGITDNEVAEAINMTASSINLANEYFEKNPQD